MLFRHDNMACMEYCGRLWVAGVVGVALQIDSSTAGPTAAAPSRVALRCQACMNCMNCLVAKLEVLTTPWGKELQAGSSHAAEQSKSVVI